MNWNKLNPFRHSQPRATSRNNPGGEGAVRQSNSQNSQSPGRETRAQDTIPGLPQPTRANQGSESPRSFVQNNYGEIQPRPVRTQNYVRSDYKAAAMIEDGRAVPKKAIPKTIKEEPQLENSLLQYPILKAKEARANPKPVMPTANNSNEIVRTPPPQEQTGPTESRRIDPNVRFNTGVPGPGQKGYSPSEYKEDLFQQELAHIKNNGGTLEPSIPHSHTRNQSAAPNERSSDPSDKFSFSKMFKKSEDTQPTKQRVLNLRDQFSSANAAFESERDAHLGMRSRTDAAAHPAPTSPQGPRTEL
jgi:hypothetical protein